MVIQIIEQMGTAFQKTTALLLAFGSLLFLVAAFLPYSRVFVEPDPEKKLAIIMEMKKMWAIGQVFFGLGAMVTVIALGFQSYGFRDIAFARWSHLGILLMFIGTLLWCWHLWERIVQPEAFAKGLHTPYLFLLYSMLTQAGLVLVGILLLKSPVVNWVGWMFIIGAGVFFLLMLIFKDMPPFVYYVLTMIASVVLFTGAD
jgi:hypothetical protein